MDFLIEKRCDLWITLRQPFPGKYGSLCPGWCGVGRPGGVRCRNRIKVCDSGIGFHGFRLFQRSSPENRCRFWQKQIFRGNLTIAPAGGVTLPGITDNDETIDIIKIPAAVADTGV